MRISVQPSGAWAEVDIASRDPTSPSRVIGGRYQVLNELGRGGMGTVYRVVERLTGRVVTLKRLHVPTGESDALQLRSALAQEFRLLASLRHPNIISVLDYGFDEQRQPYFTMDLAENASSIIEAGADEPLAMQVELLVQVLRALWYLHRFGILHCDLKPENILVVGGQVKILDFGLSIYRDAVADGGIRGTPAYMAPEALLTGAASERSDLYSFGMIAYELVTGVYPFDESDGPRLFEAVVHEPLPRPSDDVDLTLRPVLERLLRKDPGERFADAREVMLTLGAAVNRSLSLETVATRESFLQTAPLVGRRCELAMLTDALATADRGCGGTWLVGGESGVGKSRLLEELRSRALVDGVAVLRGQAVRQGGSPYHVWREMLRLLVLWGDVNDTDAEVLKALVPDIATLIGREVHDAPTLDAETAKTRLFFAIEELLRAQRRAVLLIFEDLQWAGSESLSLLTWLTHPAASLPVLMVGCFRDDEGGDIPAAIPGARVLILKRLNSDEMVELAAGMIGPAARRPDLAALLERETEGIPFFIVEVMRALAESVGSLDAIGDARLPERVLAGGVQRVVRRRLNQVPHDALPALRTAAVIGREVDSRLIRGIHANLDAADWADVCTRTAVLEVREARLRFAHDKFREQLVEDLSPSALRALHAQVATAIESTYAERTEHVAALAHHWHEASEPMREAPYASEAGMLALHSGACAEAVQYLHRALELLQMNVAAGSSGAAPRRGLRRGLLDPNAHVDRRSPAFAIGRIHGALSEAYFRLGDLKSCRDHAVRALSQFGQHVPDRRIGWVFATVEELLLRTVQSLARVRARDAGEERLIAGEVARVQLRLTETFFFSLRVMPIIWSSLRVVNQCEPAGPSPELAQGYAMLALLASPARFPRLAARWARRGLAIAEGTGVERYVAWVASRVCVNYLSECRWSDAEAAVSRATSIAERVGDLRLWAEVRAEGAMLAMFRGEFERSLTLFQESHALSRRSGNRQIACWGLTGEGGSLSRMGRDREAVDRLDDAFDMIDEDIMKTEALCVLGTLALARLRLGDRGAASEIGDRALWYIRSMDPIAYWTVYTIAATAEVFVTLREQSAPDASLERRMHHAVRAVRRFARHFPVGQPAALLWQGGESWIGGLEARALRLWGRAVDVAERLGMPYERARAHLEIGRHLPRQAEGRAHHLHQAADLLERLGCETDLARARAEVRGPSDRVETTT